VLSVGARATPFGADMLDQTYKVPQSATEILGDLTALAERLGGTDGLCPVTVAATSLGSARIQDCKSLGQFLADYTREILVPHELPAALAAYNCGTQHHVRELIRLDQELTGIPALKPFSGASGHVGLTQLRRLRPLRDERVLQRYMRAVEHGEARGWHTLVFGLILSLYSLPLRQGLVHFAYRTLGGFVDAAGERLPIRTDERQELIAAQSGPVLEAVERILNHGLLQQR
jgi:urease accessory protein UreF